MPENKSAQSAPPPHVALVQMATAYWMSHIIHAAAKLGLADLLAGGPMTAEQLAAATKTHAPSLYRLMRMLAGHGVFAEDAAHRFSLTPIGEALRTGAPGAARPTVLTMASDWFMRGFGELMYSLQTGKSGFEKSLGMPVFDYMAKHPDIASMFSETMVGFHGGEPPAVAAAYDFSGFKTVVDVGGATGQLLSGVLAKYPALRGVLFDLPHVVTDAPKLLAGTGVADRVTIDAGSFFDRVPVGGDAYMLSHIIHDWSEEQCLQILGNCRRAMKPESRLLIIEMVLPEGNEPHPGKMLDIMMLVGPGGRERTPTEYAELLGKAGMKVTRVVPTESAVSVVEARLA